MEINMLIESEDGLSSGLVLHKMKWKERMTRWGQAEPRRHAGLREVRGRKGIKCKPSEDEYKEQIGDKLCTEW